MSFLQESPYLLDVAYRATSLLLHPFRRWLKPGGKMEKAFALAEKVGKKPLFDCRMCGDCVLHDTGMTCPMTCPKNLRNGPCEGVRPNGHCEITPERLCIWVQAWERSKRMAGHGKGILAVLPPLDWSLDGTSSWINKLNR